MDLDKKAEQKEGLVFFFLGDFIPICIQSKSSYLEHNALRWSYILIFFWPFSSVFA